MAEIAVGRILDAAQKAPDAPALDIEGEVWSYRELLGAAAEIAAQLPMRKEGAPQPRVALMAHRQASAYAAILAAQLNGAAYVPINANHAPARSARILASSGVSHIVCSDLASDAFAAIVVANAELSRLKVVATGDRKADYGTPVVPDMECMSAAGDLAYILFTSGSTGQPKGVPIGHGQLAAYLSTVESLLPDIGPGDRFSQCFDLTFDLSVHDVFLSLLLGATLVVPSRSDLEEPARYIRNRGVTVWFSVPSLAYQMRLQGALSRGAFPAIRRSLFCGEALPAQVAGEWLAATPNGTVENWYGPTEATIACARHPVNGPGVEAVVPIGRPFPGMELLVLDEAMMPAKEGELYLSGPQLAEGYLNDPEKSAAAFIALPDGRSAYRTGDLARRDETGVVHFAGRADTQIKLRGYRVELGEIEAVLRDAGGGANAIALPWPWGEHPPRGIVAAIEGDIEPEVIRSEVHAQLPDYMQPSEIVVLDRFPQNASGKVDRSAIANAVADRLRSMEMPSGLSGLESRLLAAIQKIAPGMSATAILKAPSLLDAGMDSLGFVEFTMTLQRDFALVLGEKDVVRLSEVSFADIVAEIDPKSTRRRGFLAPIKSRVSTIFKRQRRSAKRRANRAIQFIKHFPEELRTDGPPLAIFLGSSGTFRGVDPRVIDEVAASFGVTLRTLNVGLPAITPDGLARICRFVRETCENAGVTLAFAVYEFDPMHLSTTPPSGDISLGSEFFTGRMTQRNLGKAAREFEWIPAENGAWLPEGDERAQERRADWVKSRDVLIARAYQGDLQIDQARLAAWKRGARELARVSNRMACFVHPADPEMLEEVPTAVETDIMETTLNEISHSLGILVIPWRDLTLPREECMNINHANALGRARLSQRLGHLLFEFGIQKKKVERPVR